MNKKDQREYQRKYYQKNKERACEYQKERYQKIKKRLQEQRQQLRGWLRTIKVERGCSRCPENHPAVLIFHHRDPSKKEYDIVKMVRAKMPKEKILKEIEKCDVMCANCHRKLHWEDLHNGA